MKDTVKQSKYTAERLAGLKPWQPGQSGNPKGRPRDTKYLSEIVRELLEQVPKGESEGRNTDILVALALIRKALGGDTKAIEMLHDWTEGKVTEKHLIAGIMATTPELLKQAQKRLSVSLKGTQELMEKYDATE